MFAKLAPDLHQVLLGLELLHGSPPIDGNCDAGGGQGQGPMYFPEKVVIIFIPWPIMVMVPFI